jgi:hypothetical protein
LSTSPLIVLERALLVHHALQNLGVKHALGGALALGYHVGESRATQDIDMNVSVAKGEAERILFALPEGVERSERDLAAVRKDGQVRLFWPVPDGVPIPLDLFFAEHAFHGVVADRAVWVPMLEDEVPILSATDLTVFKMLFDRTKDWADIEEMVKYASPTLDLDEVVRWVGEIVGQDDPRIERVRRLATSQPQPDPTTTELFKQSSA